MNSLSKRLFSVLSALLIFSLIATPAFAGERTIFGPKQYTRTMGPPNVYTDTFTLICERETISSLYRALPDKAMAGTLTKRDRYAFVSKFLNLKEDEIEETQQEDGGDAL